ncbi:MBL fold metallo-hydrolase [Roseivirga echinicomitans]|uniref:MBL fold metallo-hydrolase n=1 Tax=Roseivirga echinicomitans TaxID=296218 RepID=A0A150XJ59_9BACT|nr:MBL fold metallo-hydrolase [Roseivirga echinicomitans]KYG78754.1 MBL fold metallo-hydrolase [Roseivirga echinicomitans]
MIKIKPFTFNPFMENTYVLFDETKEAVIIDPGCYEKEEEAELVKFIESEGLKVKSLLNTHGHIDHVLGNDFVKRKFNVDLVIGEHDEETLRSVGVYAANYGFQNYTPAQPNKFLKEGDTVKFGKSALKVYFTPGHAPGHIVFVNEEENICIGGDVLFEGSIGRTDLPGGDLDTLIDSIHSKLFKLDDDMVVYPGHGGPTTIGDEKANNPFCAIKK